MSHFIHLRCHTEYSLVDSLIRIKPLVKTLRELGMPAVAVTDQGNLFALVKFYRAALAEGIKPIIGVDVWIPQDSDSSSRLVLLCQNDTGYRNLTRLISKSYLEGQQKGIPYLHRHWLTSKNTEGLIALSGGRQGDIGQALLAGHSPLATQRLEEWQALFPQRFYLELQRTGRPQEEEYIHAAVELALTHQVPVVATNEVCFISPDEFEAHEIRVCVHQGYTLNDTRRPRSYSPQQYLRAPSEMAELFADLPEAIENTWLIAQRCNLELTLGKNFLPDFPVPAGQILPEYFRQQAKLGLERRLIALFDATQPEFTQRRRPYDERLALELDVIEQMGFPGYFLIVADFIQWAKNNKIPVGPGRGSGAGSLVAYVLRITDLDPLRYELLFERFLNPERVSMPDFDIDFCMERRDEVIDYVAKRYGRERVSQITTYGTMAAKAAVRDVGRVLNHPHGYVDKIAKLIPFEVGITLAEALKQEAELQSRYQQEEEVKTLIDLAQKLEGLTRNPGKHAGGVVIAPTVLTDFTPLYCEEGGTDLITQFDKDDVEAVGLVKFDFLGLRTLTIIDWALKTINRFREQPIDISQLPAHDSATFDLLKKANTTAVFQLESTGIKKLVKRLGPDCFEDLIALVALYRPGPLQSGMVDDFIDRKHGKAKIEYPHPELTHILKPTYGVIVYQEQVMQIAQVLAGYTLGGADLLRRSMGKKKPEEMAKQRHVFIEGAVARGVKGETASYIFGLMEKFAEYGFNKSHSAAYALVSYQTAWLKAHYPAAFMAAALSADLDKTEKVVHLVEECRAMNLKISSPEINSSEYHFTVADPQTHIIRYGLGAIKGVGGAALENILQERTQQGQFTDLFDFCRRIDLRKANRRVLEGLVKAGALDKLGPHRATVMASLDSAIKLAEKHTTERATGQNDMFAGGGGGKTSSKPTAAEKPFVLVTEWSLLDQLQGEKDSIGFYLSGHPLNAFKLELSRLIDSRKKELRGSSNNGKSTVRAGWVVELRTNQTKRGKMATVTLEDQNGRLEVNLFGDLYEKKRDMLNKDTILIAEGEVREDEYNDSYSMKADEVYTLDQAREKLARRVEIVVSTPQTVDELAKRLLETLKPYQSGHCRVLIHYQHPVAAVELVLGDSWRVQPQPMLLTQLQELLGGEDKVKIVY